MSGPHRSLRSAIEFDSLIEPLLDSHEGAPTEDQDSRSDYFHVDGGVEIHIERPGLSFQEMSL
jgi:hypothetical protein